MKVVVIHDEGLDDETKKLLMNDFAAGKGCRWCGGLHQRECPRVKHIIYHPSGDERAVQEVEFWQDGQWDKSGIIFPEEVADAG